MVSTKKESIQTRLVTPNMVIPLETINTNLNPNAKYRDNKIQTSKYNFITFLPKNLFEQFYRFANLYFLIIQVINWLPGMEVFIKEVQVIPLAFVLSVTAIKDLFEDRRRHLSDKRVNNMTCLRFDVKSKHFKQTKWQDIRVGDWIWIQSNRMIPADILLLRSQSSTGENDVCYVETANLDGENNLKQRFVPPNVVKTKFEDDDTKYEEIDFNFTVECEKPNMRLHKFYGMIIYNDLNHSNIIINEDNLLLRECILRNTNYAIGLVIYAGHETKAMLNNKGPRHKRSKLERMMNRDVIICVVLLIILSMLCVMGRYFWLDQFTNISNLNVLYTEMGNPFQNLHFYWPLKMFATFFILYQMIIPISLYVVIELVKLGQIFIINRDKFLYDPINNKACECRAWNITEDLGQIEYVFCDKTGTLTENFMEFRCCSINGTEYFHNIDCDDIQSVKSIYHKSERKNELPPNYELMNKLMNIAKSDGWLPKDAEEQYIHDFFMVLAICNTVTQQEIADLKETESKTSQQLFKFFQRFNKKFQKKFSPKKQSPKMGKSQSGEPNNSIPLFASESPDEVALVTAAYQYKIVLLKRNKNSVKVKMPNEKIVEFRVLHLLPFDNVRKRMSIIIECPFTKQIILYVKGSDSTIISNLAPVYSTNKYKSELLNKTMKQITDYSNKGLRILCMGKRIITMEEYRNWMKNVENAQLMPNRDKELMKLYNLMESDLEFLGSTAVEDRLQYRVPEVIHKLRQAGIVVWILTGDKMETAISIAKSCKLFNSNTNLMIIDSKTVKSKKTANSLLNKHLKTMQNSFKGDSKQMKNEREPKTSLLRFMKKLYEFLDYSGRNDAQEQEIANRLQWGLVIDGASLNFILQKDNINLFIALTQYCSSVLCCRVTPSQKSIVVKSVKGKINVMTMAVGDGANDVAMIQMAHVGVGVIGKEGTQAAMASDFSISRFHFLERLILVHGNLCYYRLATTILYFFYKNTLVIFILFYFQFYCGFSGMSFLDDIHLMMVNIVYTTIPPIVRGILEKNCQESLLLKYPALYARGRKSLTYTYRSFWVNTLDAVYQGCVIFFITKCTYQDSPIGTQEFGLIVFLLIVITNWAHICLEVKNWNRYFALSLVLSIGHFLSTIFFLDFTYTESFVSVFGGRNYKVFMNIIGTNFNMVRLIFLVPIICLIPRFTLRVLQEKFNPQFPIPKNH